MFEKAVREKIRFPYKGLVSVEDLWDLSVLELDSIYKTLNMKLKAQKEESLLQLKTKEDTTLDLQISIIKHIVEIKFQEAEIKKKDKERKDQKQKILEILASKKDQALQGKSEEELEKMLQEL